MAALARGDAIPRLLRPDEDHATGLTRLNQDLFVANRDRSLAEVRAAFDHSFEQALAAVAALAEQDIFDPHGLGGGLNEAPLHAIASDTYAHYAEHSAMIRRWRELLLQAEHWTSSFERAFA